MNKGNQKKFLCLFIVASLLMTGCGELSSFVKGSPEDMKNTEYHMEKSQVYPLGEELPWLYPTNEDPECIRGKYTVKKAALYTNPTEVGITKEQIISVDDQRAIERGIRVTEDDIMEAPILIFDIVLTQMEATKGNISSFSLVERVEGDQMEYISSPCYFSEGVHDNKSVVNTYYHYSLEPGESMEFQIGFYLGADEYRLEDLFLADYGEADPELIHYIDLDLQGGVQ